MGQEENSELKTENSNLASKLAETEKQFAAFKVRSNKDIFCLKCSLQSKEMQLKWEARKEKEVVEKELLEMTKAYKELEQTLKRHETETQAAESTSHYKILLEMAECMSLIGEREEEELDSDHPTPTFQDHVHLLVRKCLEGSRLGVREVGRCQMEVFGLLNHVYVTAASKREKIHVLVSTLTGAAAKVPKRRRISNENGRPAW